MKRKVILIVILLVLGGIYFILTLSDEPLDESERYVNIEKTIRKQKLIADLDSLVSFFEKIHPNPYRFQSKSDFLSFLEQKKVSFPDSLSIINFWRLVDEVTCRYNDAHSNATDFYVLNDYVQKKGTFFPFDAENQNQKLFITRSHLKRFDTLIGSEIKRINGLNTETLVQKLVRQSSRETEALDLKEVSEDFGFYLWKTFDWGPNFEIEYQTKNDALLDTLKIDGVLWENRKDDGIKEEQSYNFNFLNEAIGYMKIMDFNNGSRKDFNNFYEESFKRLKESKSEYLILDFRGHDGGADQYGEDLAKYISAKPFRKMKKTIWKVTPEFKQAFDRRFVPKGIRWFKPIYLFNEYSKVFYGANSYDTIVVEPEFKFPNKESERFTGNVFLIIDHNTFSAGSIFAEMFKHFKMGTVVGQPSGNLTSFNGFALSEYVLPNSKLTIKVSSAYNIANSGNEGLQTVVPDVFIDANDDPIQFIEKSLID